VSIPLALSTPGAGVSLGAATSATLVIQDNNPYPAPIQIASLTTRTVGFKVGTGHRAKFKKETVIDLQFTGAINGAGNLGAYQLLSGKTRRGVTTYNKKVPLASVSYNSTTDVATLFPAGTLDLSQPEELIVTASMLTDAYGRPLDGDDDGVPGGNYIAIFGRGGAPMDREP
jgi:hypothetical protein